MWLILSLVLIFNLGKKWSRIYFARKLQAWSLDLMPYLGTILFLPFVSVLLSIFACDEGTGSGITDSFLAKDCHISCWAGKHLWYAILAGIALVCYVPAAVYCRPIWQDNYSGANILVQPRLTLTKSVVQVFLIMLNLTVYKYSQLAHAFLFFCAMLGYAVFLIYNPPFNYKRPSFTQVACLFGLAWLSLVSTLNSYIDVDWFWMMVLGIGWSSIFIVCCVFIWKKTKSCLYTVKDKLIPPMIRFQFSNKRPEEFGIFPKVLNYYDSMDENLHCEVDSKR